MEEIRSGRLLSERGGVIENVIMLSIWDRFGGSVGFTFNAVERFCEGREIEERETESGCRILSSSEIWIRIRVVLYIRFWIRLSSPSTVCSTYLLRNHNGIRRTVFKVIIPIRGLTEFRRVGQKRVRHRANKQFWNLMKHSWSWRTWFRLIHHLKFKLFLNLQSFWAQDRGDIMVVVVVGIRIYWVGVFVPQYCF